MAPRMPVAGKGGGACRWHGLEWAKTKDASAMRQECTPSLGRIFPVCNSVLYIICFNITDWSVQIRLCTLESEGP